MEQNKPQTEQDISQQAAVRRQKLADLDVYKRQLFLVLVGHAFRLLRWEQFIRIYERPLRGQIDVYKRQAPPLPSSPMGSISSVCRTIKRTASGPCTTT